MKNIKAPLKITSIFILIIIYIYGKIFKSQIITKINIYEKENIELLRESASESTLFLTYFFIQIEIFVAR